MIICVCRNIKESDFVTKQELIKRIMQLDHNCGQCQEYVQKLIDYDE
jgi:bacterioferritin-associated ferredoxin